MAFPIIFKIATLVLFAFFQEGCFTVLEKEGEETLKKKKKTVSSLPESFQYFLRERNKAEAEGPEGSGVGGGQPCTVTRGACHPWSWSAQASHRGNWV